MNLEWRQPSKKLRFILLDTKYVGFSKGVKGRVEERKQRNGTILWEGIIYAPTKPRILGALGGKWKSQMFRKKAEAMAMVAVSVKLENYDGFE